MHQHLLIPVCGVIYPNSILYLIKSGKSTTAGLSLRCQIQGEDVEKRWVGICFRKLINGGKVFITGGLNFHELFHDLNTEKMSFKSFEHNIQAFER